MTGKNMFEGSRVSESMGMKIDGSCTRNEDLPDLKTVRVGANEGN